MPSPYIYASSSNKLEASTIVTNSLLGLGPNPVPNNIPFPYLNKLVPISNAICRQSLVFQNSNN